MKLLDRYIAREILLPFAVVILILAGLFASFSSARLLAGAVTESLGIAALFKLVFLKTLISLEVLIAIALYISVIIGLGRLNKDHELTVLRSVGISTTRIVWVVLTVAIPIGIISGILSSYIRPWAYTESYILDAQAEAELNTNRFQAGRFHGSERSGRVIYVQEKNESIKQMQHIFHYVKNPHNSEIVIAKQAFQVQPTSSEQKPYIQLSDGVIYKLSNDASVDAAIEFKNMTYYIDTDYVLNYRRKAAATRTLWESEEPRDIAEFQWRISRPLATILLALLAVTFIRISPRQDKTDRTYLIAALLFAAYYNLNGLAKTWVENGIVGAFPGMWWLDALMLIGFSLYAFSLKYQWFGKRA